MEGKIIVKHILKKENRATDRTDLAQDTGMLTALVNAVVKFKIP
jgi:hypothetical protein